MTREASDRFLTEVCGWEFDPGTASLNFPTWRSPDGRNFRANESCSLAQANIFSMVPDPMGNLQDALAFVPEGYSWWVVSDAEGNTAILADSPVIAIFTEDKQWEGCADTPAQALCAAIRKEKEKDDG